MKKIILFLLVNVICTLLFSQGIYIETRDYKGYIFPGDYEAYGFPPTPNNFTPSRENIEDAEQVLREYFKKYSFKPCIKCQSINKKTLKKYFRQYAGKLAENGNKIIYINFIYIES